MSLLVRGIGELVTNDPALGVLHEAALVVSDGRIAWVGADAGAPAADEVLDVGGAAVLPGFVDSHTHLVFAGDRAAEFAARMAGQPYTGGGIRTTVAAMLPGAEFSTRSPYPDARALLDAGATVALATDCNPGSSYTSSMPLCI